MPVNKRIKTYAKKQFAWQVGRLYQDEDYFWFLPERNIRFEDRDSAIAWVNDQIKKYRKVSALGKGQFTVTSAKYSGTAEVYSLQIIYLTPLGRQREAIYQAVRYVEVLPIFGDVT